jgi:hypothetical protein
MNCELINFSMVSSNMLFHCVHQFFVLSVNSQNISSSLLLISYPVIVRLHITSEGELLTNSGIHTNNGLIWTLVCTKIPCSVYSGSDWMINLHPSSQHIFHTLITCSAQPWLWLCCIIYKNCSKFRLKFWQLHYYWTANSLSMSLYTIHGGQKCWNILFSSGNFFYTSVCRTQSKMDLVRWF